MHNYSIAISRQLGVNRHSSGVDFRTLDAPDRLGGASRALAGTPMEEGLPDCPPCVVGSSPLLAMSGKQPSANECQDVTTRPGTAKS